MKPYEELISELQEGEVVEAIVFGDWGEGKHNEHYPFVPVEQRGKILTLEEAKPFMEGWVDWNFRNRKWGKIRAYAAYIWTNQRIIWITQYEGTS